jgi:hypothetical protein
MGSGVVTQPRVHDRAADVAVSQGRTARSQALLSRPRTDRESPRPRRDGGLTSVSGYGERMSALEMVGPVAMTGRVTLAADNADDSGDFVGLLRLLQVTPHVAENTSNRSRAIDRRTPRHAGYEMSEQTHKRIEEIFGEPKIVGLIRQTRHHSLRRVR